ncbi:MAG: histidine kinase [Desulfobacteraceae bacterium]|nr:histidine kinase [Desulfobacteraceae bacterium]
MMKLQDVLSLDQWIEFENEIRAHSGLNAGVFDVQGTRITNNVKFPNRLCPKIKANEKGQAYICSSSHMNIANMAQKRRKAVIEECDAGMVKLAVPIFVGDTFLGVIGGCGMLRNDGEPESFLINKITGLKEDKIADLSSDIPKIDSEKIEQLAAFIEKKLEKIVMPDG